ncbi:hypothetical protein [Stenotrophomonas maltophilia]|uniref:hypothetical protein n=1 Tax=Stenotrophomonas maltophilia TaxID=40324 RepID=UPI0039F724B7
MLPSTGYQGFSASPIPSGWVERGGRWDLWWNGRSVAHIATDDQPGVTLCMNGQKMWQVKRGRAANLRQGKRFAERWCAARLYPDLPLRQGVARLTDSTPIQPAPPLPGLPPTREQLQQAQRLGEAAATASARVMAALEPIRPLAVTRPRARDPMKAWVRAARG